MVIGEQIKQKIASFPAGVVFTISDFGFDPSNDPALAKALSRMTAYQDIPSANSVAQSFKELVALLK